MNLEKPVEKNVEPAKSGETNIPVLGIATGLTESVKEAQQAEKALARSRDPGRTEAERSAAGRAAAIHGRRALFKAVSTVLTQLPAEGTAASLTLDGANMILDQIEGDPTKLEKSATRNITPKQTSTESFMQSIREQAATEIQQQNGERPAIRQ
ncbi:MAG TPA: hypothetical protein VN939_02985 [Chthoniobacterales bacterium]|jgi:hypothetical protein|nr:hypothetical protein [Chthoniobacterales bacterium]